MMAILSEPSSVMSFPPKPNSNKPALNLFVISLISEVLYFFQEPFILAAIISSFGNFSNCNSMQSNNLRGSFIYCVVVINFKMFYYGKVEKLRQIKKVTTIIV